MTGGVGCIVSETPIANTGIPASPNSRMLPQTQPGGYFRNLEASGSGLATGPEVTVVRLLNVLLAGVCTLFRQVHPPDTVLYRGDRLLGATSE